MARRGRAFTATADRHLALSGARRAGRAHLDDSGFYLGGGIGVARVVLDNEWGSESDQCFAVRAASPYGRTFTATYR